MSTRLSYLHDLFRREPSVLFLVLANLVPVVEMMVTGPNDLRNEDG